MIIVVTFGKRCVDAFPTPESVLNNISILRDHHGLVLTAATSRDRTLLSERRVLDGLVGQFAV